MWTSLRGHSAYHPFLSQGMTNPNPTPQMGFKKLPPPGPTHSLYTFRRDSDSELKEVVVFSALSSPFVHVPGWPTGFGVQALGPSNHWIPHCAVHCK